MAAFAIAARHEDRRLALFLRIVRAPSGIYVVFSAGQRRDPVGGRRYDPHSSWHRDGRVHHKSYDRALPGTRQRQPLDAFRGAEPFVATSAELMLAPGYPDCDPAGFSGVIEIPAHMLSAAPGRQQLHVDLVAPGFAPPPVGGGERALERWSLDAGIPGIVVSLYEFPVCNGEAPGPP